MATDTNHDFDTVPMFDLSEPSNDQFITRLREACHQVGFFYIKNHGISSNLMKQMLQLTNAFFNLPQHEKDAVSLSFSPHYRGYGKLRAETTKGIPDKKETFDLGLEYPAREKSSEHPYFILQGPNQWPSSETLNQLRWKETILEYLSAIQKVGEQLLAAMSLTLGFPEHYLLNKFCSNKKDAYAILRLLRYPPGRTTEKNQDLELGVGPHVDAGCLIMLLQDDIGGLQVQNSRGEWIDAPPIPDTLVVNIGEMLQIWSDNYFQATPHRVINTSSAIRHSVPFFFEPNLTAAVSPLEISPELLARMNRPRADKNTRIIYGEHMLRIYERSFQQQSS